MLACCSAASHPWELFNVQQHWLPETLRCFIIGENPGDTDSQYFYDQPQSYDRDRVIVRKCLLRSLHDQQLISEATLEGFRSAGFLFDHAIRCPLSKTVVKAERQAARRYASIRVENSGHLLVLLSQASVVWVMGHIACNAVANIWPTFSRARRSISKSPYPGELASGSKFFVSEYFNRWNQSQHQAICKAFARFAENRGVIKSPR